MKSIKKTIDELDVKSEEFFELYTYIADKYYRFEKPDTFQQSLSMVHQWMDKSSGGNWESHVILLATMVKELFLMKDKKSNSCTGTVGFSNETFHFDIYTSEVEKDKMDDMLRDIGGKIKSGEFSVKNKGFGKNPFNKK